MSGTIEAGSNSVPNPARREFLRRFVGAIVIASGAGVVVGSIESARRHYENREALYDKAVEGRGGELKVTDNYPDKKPILVRSEPNTNDENIIGWAEPGLTVQVRAWHGHVYPGVNGLGEFEGADGNSYGLWFRVVGLPAYVKKGDQVVREAVHNVYIAGNFLRPVTEQEKTDFYTSSG